MKKLYAPDPLKYLIRGNYKALVNLQSPSNNNNW